MQPEPAVEVYKVKLMTRCTIGGVRWRAGAIISVPPDKLRVASHLCRTGAARPFDAQTARDVELHLLLKKALKP